MASRTVFSVIPCEICENDNEKDFTFYKSFTTDSEYVICNVCGERSPQLYCMDVVLDDKSVKESTPEGDTVNDDAALTSGEDCGGESVDSPAQNYKDEDLDFKDEYFGESVGSLAKNYKDEMKNAMQKQDNDEQPVFKCLKCNASGKEQFIQMLDGEGSLAWWKCMSCNEEYNQDGCHEPGAESQFKLRPCSSCQAYDPNHFIIQECAESKDIVLVCGWCDVIHQTLVKVRRPEVTDMVCECGNKELDCFKVDEDAHGNVTKTTCLICDRKQDYTDESPITCSKCKNTDSEQFELVDDGNGNTNRVICQYCGSKQAVGKLVLTPDYSKDSFLDKLKVTSHEELKMGDHIGFHRKVGYWHHAIVVDVDKPSGRLKLIEYTKKRVENSTKKENKIIKDDQVQNEMEASNVKTTKKKRFCIQEYWSDPIDWVKDAVHCIRYEPGKSSDPDTVISRARQKLGEMKYNLFTNNCEHFAIWAKTGEEASFQVQEYTKIAAVAGTQWVVGSIVNMAALIARINGTCIIGMHLPAICSTAGMAGLSLLDVIPCGISVAVEIFHTGYKIYKDYKDKKKKEKKIDELKLTPEEAAEKRKEVQHEFKEKIVDNATQAVWQTGWSLGGFLAFQLLIPVPILGGIVGGVIGALIGTATRQKIGALAVTGFNKVIKTPIKKDKEEEKSSKCTIS